MNRKDLKEYFRTLAQSTEKEQNKSSMLNESADDWKAKRKAVGDADFNIDAQFLAAIISRGMDVLRGIWMVGEETDRLHAMIDNNTPLTDIIAYLRELEAAGRTYKDVEDLYDLPDADDKWGDDVGVEDQARFDAKNNNKDVTLYRDNPVYRDNYDDEIGDHSEEYKKMTDSFSPYDK